ncbi:MAG: M28 family metallopeptidase [Pseudomonadota bacterium]
MFRPSFRPAVFGIALSLPLFIAACATAPKPAATVAPQQGWYRDVAAMADAGDNAARRAHLQTRLERLGLRVEQRAFAADTLQGENLLADLGGPADAPLLLIGAHSDRVDAGRGATDNASGSAVVLALAERLRRKPLAHHRVRVAFWDLEEHGLLGASAYIEQNGERPALYINFDVFGWGDNLWMMTADAAHPLVAASREAAQAQGLAITAGEQYPPSDHRAFLKAGWPAVSYSLVGSEEIPGILEMFAGKRPMSRPKVMNVIHSPADTVEQVDANAAEKGVDAVEAAIRRWDAAAG